jgi:2,4-dienoyl-CoA reductase-like NADH-dependent reductase (Old Yellow Enzyme family)
MARIAYPRVASFKTSRAAAEYLARLGWPLRADEEVLTAPESPLSQRIEIPWRGARRRIGNRIAVQPMEGWDGESDGRPSELTRRRWLNFATSGAKLLWGCEAVAVLPEARANPNQLLMNEANAPHLGALGRELRRAHRERFGTSDDLVIGLQLTHSGRFSRPREKTRLEPVIAYHHPILDSKFPACAGRDPISDAEVARVVRSFAAAARLAWDAGFDFVDLKHCHGYLGHEFLSARTREGAYGGSFENRTRFLREMAAAVRDAAPGLEIGVRLSAFDSVPYSPDPVTSEGVPAQPPDSPYFWGFGVNPDDPRQPDLFEAKRLLKLLRSLEIRLVNISAGSPYYSPHLQRPALFPPCDGYLPPEDPFAGAARLIAATRDLKATASDLVFVSSGWSYFQEFLPHFAQSAVREGWTDLAGLGRMMLPYPELPSDVLEKGVLNHKKICRTFSECTNGPRHGMVSGCFPLDPFYKARPEWTKLQASKAEARSSRKSQPEGSARGAED